MERRYNGLTDAEVAASRSKHGTNDLVKQKTKGFWGLLWENLSDPIIRILMIALLLEVVFTFGKCDFIELGGIVSAILISSLVSTLSECGSERAFRALERENIGSGARVVRNGKLGSVLSRDIVVGDIIYLGAGERVEADGVIIDGEISVDQSALNGEDREVTKRVGGSGEGLYDERLVFRGSLVCAGNAVMRASAVGEKSFYGMVARDVQTDTRISPLKLRLTKLASQISKIGYVIAILVGFTYLLRTIVVENHFDKTLIMTALSDGAFIFSTLIHALTLMITVIVVAVPEGLPMMITVVLSVNMKRMVRDKILVKKPVGIETAGSLNVLFTDKTGTLTEGVLSVDRVICEDKIYKEIGSFSPNGAILEMLLYTAYFNTSSEISDGRIVGGNSTDRAILDFFRRDRAPKAEISSKTPFSSEIKYSSVTFSDGRELIKGAPDVILPRCTLALGAGGESTASELAFPMKKYREAISRGERVIAVAKKEGSSALYSFVALIVLKDKVRKDVKAAVKSALDAGIQVVMLTGDNKDTAIHIAEECGFYSPHLGHLAISSEEMARLSDEELALMLPSIRILSRALPQDKTRLVRISQQMNLVVGMTGDGVNDAPSLKLADVGFAMGSGTDIAKSAGDIVILDNSFRSITKTVLYGRTIFKSIRKFITFQLIMNLAACGITLIGQFMGIESPITIIQMLWVNIIMDTLGGLAFAGEAPLDYYMNDPPKRRDEPILDKASIRHIILNGAFTLGLLALFLEHPFFRAFYSSNSSSVAFMTAFYALFIFSGLVNCLCARSERLWIFSNITKNRLFLAILALISVIQIIIIYYGGELFRSTPLSEVELNMVLGLSALVLLFDTMRRLVARLS